MRSSNKKMKVAQISFGKLMDFDNHHTAIRIENQALKVAGFITIHRRIGETPSLGATRMWPYSSEGEALADALKLSRMMSYKLAFSGFPYGGAKAVLIANPQTADERKNIFEWYAKEVNGLNGMFITGSDMGVNDGDLAILGAKTPFVIGHNVPAGYYTALGAFATIKSTLQLLYGSREVQNRTFAVQGLGKTGYELVRLLYGEGARITVADIDEKARERAVREFPGIAVTGTATLLKLPVDILCPCALGGIIDEAVVAKLQCKAIVGSANYPFSHREIADALHKRGIWYAVDYITNSGGVISVIDQYQHGTHDDSRIKKNIEATQKKLSRVFAGSHLENISPQRVADRMAEEHMTPLVIK